MIVVEHDEETILAADHVVDMGPGAGVHGGRVVVAGPPAAIAGCAESLTGQQRAGHRGIAEPAMRTPCDPKRQLLIRGARQQPGRRRLPVGLYE